MSSDGLRDAARSDREQIGGGPHSDAVIADAKRLRAGRADQVKGDLHLGVAPEVRYGEVASSRCTLSGY